MFPGDSNRRVITSGQITGNNVINRFLLEHLRQSLGLGLFSYTHLDVYKRQVYTYKNVLASYIHFYWGECGIDHFLMLMSQI